MIECKIISLTFNAVLYQLDLLRKFLGRSSEKKQCRETLIKIIVFYYWSLRIFLHSSIQLCEIIFFINFSTASQKLLNRINKIKFSLRIYIIYTLNMELGTKCI